MLWPLLCSFTLVIADVEKQFNLPPALRSPYYDVEFLTRPVPGIESMSDQYVIGIKTIDGSYKCALPNTTHNASLEKLTDAGAIAEARKMIAGLKHETPLMYLDDVWAWYFNFNSSLMQFFPRRTLENVIVDQTSDHVAVGRTNNSRSLALAEPVVVDDKHMLLAKYSNGTWCDITREPRTTNVFFACNPDAEDDYPTIMSLDEPYSCYYEVVFGLRQLCSIPEFKDPKIATNVIRCGVDPAEYVEPELDSEAQSVDQSEPVSAGQVESGLAYTRDHADALQHKVADRGFSYKHDPQYLAKIAAQLLPDDMKDLMVGDYVQVAQDSSDESGAYEIFQLDEDNVRTYVLQDIDGTTVLIPATTSSAEQNPDVTIATPTPPNAATDATSSVNTSASQSRDGNNTNLSPSQLSGSDTTSDVTDNTTVSSTTSTSDASIAAASTAATKSESESASVSSDKLHYIDHAEL